MNFMQWLNSLDELLYEIVSWIVFFPITLWKSIRHPLATMAYAETELSREDSEQFSATLSPPVFLVLALAIAHAVGIAVGGGTNPIVRSQHGLASLVDDNMTLLLLRIVLFSTFPLILATRMVRRHPTTILDRTSLKAPFYAQCFLAAPFSLGVNMGGSLAVMHLPVLRWAGVIVIGATFIGYGAAQTLWFARRLVQSKRRSFADASIGMVGSLLIAAAFAALFVV